MKCVLNMSLKSTLNITHTRISRVSKCAEQNTLVTIFSLYCTVLYCSVMCCTVLHYLS
jgi:hypothetical protein